MGVGEPLELGQHAMIFFFVAGDDNYCVAEDDDYCVTL